MIKKSFLLIFLLLLNLPLLFATSTSDFTEGSSVVFLADNFHIAISNEISYDIKDYLSNRNLECDLFNCESNISRQKWLIDSEVSFNKNLKYLIIMPLSYYGFEKSLQSAVDKGIHVIILEDDINFANATKLLIPWKKATTSLLDYVSSSHTGVSTFVEIQGNLMKFKSSVISTEFKNKVQQNNWNIYGINENCASRQLGLEKTLSLYRATVDKQPTYFFVHTMEASRGFLDATLMTNQDYLTLLSLDINDAIKKSILSGYCYAGIYYKRNYGELIGSLIENDNKNNYTYYIHYQLVSKDLLNE